MWTHYKFIEKGNAYSTISVKRSLKKKDKAKVLMTNGSLMKVKSIAECDKGSILPLSHSAILLTCSKR